MQKETEFFGNVNVSSQCWRTPTSYVNQLIADAGLEQGDEQLEFMFDGDADEVWADNNPRIPPILPIALGI